MHQKVLKINITASYNSEKTVVRDFDMAFLNNEISDESVFHVKQIFTFPLATFWVTLHWG